MPSHVMPSLVRQVTVTLQTELCAEQNSTIQICHNVIIYHRYHNDDNDAKHPETVLGPSHVPYSWEVCKMVHSHRENTHATSCLLLAKQPNPYPEDMLVYFCSNNVETVLPTAVPFRSANSGKMKYWYSLNVCGSSLNGTQTMKLLAEDKTGSKFMYSLQTINISPTPEKNTQS